MSKVVKLIDVKIYTNDFPAGDIVNARVAREWFFLTTNDLKVLQYDSSSGGRGSKAGSHLAKYYNVNEVRETAIQKHGSVAVLIKRAKALNKKRESKKISDQQNAFMQKEVEKMITECPQMRYHLF
mmetsp:Transcript_25454/g.28479  ORF Transcript_25454/g.28479 Transcript_25454/m.28479 type:complete len:126 (+) Transcript_25454:85-462(+)